MEKTMDMEQREEVVSYNRAKVWQLVMFAMNNASTNIYLFTFMFVTYFSTGVLGSAAIFVSQIMGYIRIFDGFIDPAIGIMIDKTDTKFGKYRPILIIGNVITALSLIFLLALRGVDENIRFPLFILVLIIHKIGYSMQQTITKAGQTALTNDPKQRPIFNIVDAVMTTSLMTGGQFVVSVFLVPKFGNFTPQFFNVLIFGTIAADIFGISEQERTSFLKEWDRVNLYSRTRGVNRFVGLVMGLEFAGVEHIDKLKEWVETTDSLSNNSLELALANDFSRDLEKALEWSNEVNRQIKNYEGDSLAFSGVLESLERLSQFGNVYVVSSANKEAVWQEWEEQGLLKYVDDIYCQDRGKKEDVIATLIASGYCRETILMVGDSLGDLAAAEQNGIAFYPVLVGKEVKSWEILREDIGEAFAKGQFEQQRQKESINTFWANLDN